MQSNILAHRCVSGGLHLEGIMIVIRFKMNYKCRRLCLRSLAMLLSRASLCTAYQVSLRVRWGLKCVLERKFDRVRNK